MCYGHDRCNHNAASKHSVMDASYMSPSSPECIQTPRNCCVGDRQLVLQLHTLYGHGVGEDLFEESGSRAVLGVTMLPGKQAAFETGEPLVGS